MTKREAPVTNQARRVQNVDSSCVFLIAPPGRKLLVCVKNHAPNVGGQVRGGGGLQTSGAVYTKNEPNRSVTKCGVDTPSEPNSEIPTLGAGGSGDPLSPERVDVGMECRSRQKKSN